MLRRAHIALAAGFALAACNQGPGVSVTNASPEEVAKAAAASGVTLSLKPGKWESSAEIVSVDIPGMPAEMVERIKQGARMASKFSYCITPEQASKPDAGMFSGQKPGSGHCTYDHFTMSGGKVDMKMSCADQSGAPAITVTSSGTYTADTMDTQAAMTTARMNEKVHSTAHWIGATCDAVKTR